VSGPVETYLGWQELRHFDGCRRPQWTADVRTDTDVSRERHGGPAHECPQQYDTCGHGSSYTRTTVRLVCPSCEAAFVFRGEGDSHWGGAATTADGYGLAPRKVGGLLLWPGRPHLPYGRLSSGEAHDFVVTRTGVKRVTEEDVVGQIMQTVGKRRGVVWTATALPRENGRYGNGRLRWSAVSGDSALRTVPAAVRWIAARLAEQDGGAG